MPKTSLVIALVEDVVHQAFARRYLKCLGYKNHEMVFEKLAAGEGSGEQRVRDQYPRVVGQYRQRQQGKRAETAALVVIDADRFSVSDRERQMSDGLLRRSMEPRQTNDRIAHWIPKWSIETWVLCLHGQSVTEDKTCKDWQPVADEMIRSSAESFYAGTRPSTPAPNHWTPSLAHGAEEAKRLEARTAG